MGAIYDFEKEKLVVGVIYHDKDVLEDALADLVKEFGEWDAVSEDYSFSEGYSTYYDGELGGEGIRRIYSFKKLQDPDMQAEIKEFTNELEKKYSKDGVHIGPEGHRIYGEYVYKKINEFRKA